MIRFPRDAYGVSVASERMDPVYRVGDTAWIAPHRRTLKAGRDFLLAKAGGTARLSHVVGFTAGYILARQYNPRRTVRLSRKVWEVAGEVFAAMRA